MSEDYDLATLKSPKRRSFKNFRRGASFHLRLVEALLIKAVALPGNTSFTHKGKKGGLPNRRPSPLNVSRCKCHPRTDKPVTQPLAGWIRSLSIPRILSPSKTLPPVHPKGRRDSTKTCSSGLKV
jgi:hypothetical protein